MKTTLLIVTLLALILPTFAKADIAIDLVFTNLKQCQKRVQKQRTIIGNLQYDLERCQYTHTDLGYVRDLETKNQKLKNINYRLTNRVLKLEEKLREYENPYPSFDDRFNLAKSIKACGKITNSSYAKKCTKYAREYEIKAKVIRSCMNIDSSYYQLECVNYAGLKSTNAAQVTACSQISNSSYAVKCVAFAGNKNIPANLIRSCMEISNNSYYQLECVMGL